MTEVCCCSLGPSGIKVEPLLDEPIPESYSMLQDVVRETAEVCMNDKKKPILTKKEYMWVSHSAAGDVVVSVLYFVPFDWKFSQNKSEQIESRQFSHCKKVHIPESVNPKEGPSY